MRKFFLSCLASSALLAQAPAPSVLTDQRIYDLVTMGVSTPEIMRIIAAAPKIEFDLRPESTDTMLKAGVSEDILKAMAAREGGQARAVRATLPLENGVQPEATEPPRQQRKLLRNEAVPVPQDYRRRVFVAGANDAWSMNYGKNGGVGGSHPQTVELMKTFGQSCPNVVITNKSETAEYIVAFERESSKLWRRDNKMAVFNQSGDMVYSASKRELGNAVRGFCASLR